jgi:hypothetical protein
MFIGLRRLYPLEKRVAMTDEYSTHELPPFFTTWKQMYAAVIANLLFLILLFYWITRYFS